MTKATDNSKGTTKPPPTDTGACGTVTGYRKHVKRREQTCAPCRKANREYHRDRSARIRNGEHTVRTSKKQKRRDAEALGAAIVEENTPTPARKPGDVYPAYLKAAGRALWDSVTADFDLNPGALQVLTHACRMTDQLERFTAALSSKSTLWFELDVDEADADKGVPVVVNGMIGEGRQLSNAIRQSLSQIGVLKTTAGGSGTSVKDQLKAKREERLRKAREAEQSKVKGAK